MLQANNALAAAMNCKSPSTAAVVDLNDLIASSEAVLTGSATVSADGELQIGVNQVGGIEFLTQINNITVRELIPDERFSMTLPLVDFSVDDGVTTTEIPGDAQRDRPLGQRR